MKVYKSNLTRVEACDLVRKLDSRYKVFRNGKNFMVLLDDNFVGLSRKPQYPSCKVLNKKQ